MPRILQLLEQSLIEAALIDIGSFKRSGDRILAMLDSARFKLCSVREPDATAQATEDETKAVLQEIATTIDGKANMEKPETFRPLQTIARSISLPSLIWILQETVARRRAPLEHQVAEEDAYQFLLERCGEVPREDLYELLRITLERMME